MKQITVNAYSSKKRIIINRPGNHKVIHAVVFSSQQMEILNKASMNVTPIQLLKRK